MHIRVTILGVILLSTAVVLLWPPQEERLTSEEELQRLVDGITAGQVLYKRSVEYRRSDPTNIPTDSPFYTPESTRSESWYAQDSEGEIILYTSVSRDMDGRLVRMSRLEDGRMTVYYLSTGAQLRHPQGLGIPDSVTDYVRFVWPWPIGEGYTQVEAGDWQGQNAVALERKRIAFTGPQLVSVYEYVEDRPILHSWATYEEDEEGKRTLIDEDRVVSYRLLPAASIPQIQVTPCVEDEESLRAGTCLRY